MLVTDGIAYTYERCTFEPARGLGTRLGSKVVVEGETLARSFGNGRRSPSADFDEERLPVGVTFRLVAEEDGMAICRDMPRPGNATFER